MKANRGFTVTELLVVVVILSLLAVIGIYNYTDYKIRAKVAEGLSIAPSMLTELTNYYNTNGKFPGTLGSTAGDYVLQTSPAAGIVHLKWSAYYQKAEVEFNGIGNQTGARIIQFTPSVVNGSLTWTCSSHTAAAGYRINCDYLPDNCKSSCL